MASIQNTKFGSSRDGVSRTISKLDKRMADGEYYEAHQLYRTLYFRYISQEKYIEASSLLMKGALAMLDANQLSSGVDLALLFVNTLEKYKISVNSEHIEKVTTLHRRLGSHMDRQNFVITAMRWSQNHDTNIQQAATAATIAPSAATAATITPAAASKENSIAKVPLVGDPQLHAGFAVTYWNEHDYCQARYHFVRSCDGQGCAAMLVEYHVSCGFPNEVDLFIAQTVFQYLCLKNRITAEICFHSYTKQHPQVERGPPFLQPLLNFLWMLLLIIDRGNLAIFTVLCEQYNPSLKRDASYHDYIAKIGQLFFHLPPPTKASRNIFDNLLSSLWNADEDGSDEEIMPTRQIQEDELD